MLYDFAQINKNSKTPVYQQIYALFQKEIEQGNLKKNTKLPSIRNLSKDLSVSKTTVESAYNQLCIEGYIISKVKKGYFVNAELQINKTKTYNSPEHIHPPVQYTYDFSSKGIESNSNAAKLWKKFINSVINKEYLINQYGHAQGEIQLRQALQKYSFSVRGVTSGAERIVIGAGTQPLLYILCGLLPKNKTVMIEKNAYPQAEQVFRDCNCKIEYIKSDSSGAILENITEKQPDMIVINPNFNEQNGTNMPIERRINLIRTAKKHNCIIIEDDYNGELRYNTQPVQAIQGYDPETVVYLGSFSKLLLPSVRMSYMVLPQHLLQQYSTHAEYYNQTASKIEQLALAEYLSSGKFETHLRKARKHFSIKCREMIKAVKTEFGETTPILVNETALYLSFKVQTPLSNAKIHTLCKKHSINVKKEENPNYTVRLSFSGIETEKIQPGIKAVRSLLLPLPPECGK